MEQIRSVQEHNQLRREHVQRHNAARAEQVSNDLETADSETVRAIASEARGAADLGFCAICVDRPAGGDAMVQLSKEHSRHALPVAGLG